MPATLAPAPASRAVMQRTKALDQYLSRIRSPTVVPGPAASIIAELRGDPWIGAQFRGSAASVDGESAGLPEFVAHGCAFLAKCHSDMGALNASPDLDKTTLYTYQAELMLDVAIGTALLRELQPAVDEAVGAGDLADAKGLTQLGHRLRKVIASAQKALSEVGRSDADRLADAMTEQPREDSSSTGALDQAARKIGGDHDRAKRKSDRRRQVLSQVRLPLRTETLVVALACSLLIWAGMVKLPQLLDKGPRLIVGEDFPVMSVREVVARPPGLYVTLDAATWDSADVAARDALIAEVVSVPLVDDDYRGALIKTNDGRPVAVWTRATGFRLLEILEPATLPGAAEKATIFVP